jgi:tetraacyldisaccharide 4'-kinase
VEFRDLVSGRRRGVWAAVLRGALRVAEVPYTWAVRRRNRRYQSGAAAVYRVAVPVISVGNLTLGGTGKTPMVQWLARWLAGRQISVGIVSRGYGAAAGSREQGKAWNDEALELAWNLPNVPHVQQPDRVAAARRVIDEFQCRVILLDDGFQHRRIARDLDLVLLDALEPLGFGHVFPRGTLREPLEGLARADVVALSRADLIGPDQRGEIRRQVEHYAPRAQWMELAHRPEALVGVATPADSPVTRAQPAAHAKPQAGAEQPLESLAGQRVLAFCGIGNPAGFRHTLAACGYRVVEFLEFPDHHGYTRRDLDRLVAAAGRFDVAAILCTRKDLVKLGSSRLGDRPLWAVRIGLEILAGREAFEARLARVVFGAGDGLF